MSALIAVVDDDTLFVEVLSDLLAEEGYQVQTYKNGADAFPQLRDQPPALIILDIPGIAPTQGWKTLELLCSDPMTMTVPIIVCSADIFMLRDQADRLAALHISVLEKPFSIEDLLIMIDQALGCD